MCGPRVVVYRAGAAPIIHGFNAVDWRGVGSPNSAVAVCILSVSCEYQWTQAWRKESERYMNHLRTTVCSGPHLYSVLSRSLPHARTRDVVDVA